MADDNNLLKMLFGEPRPGRQDLESSPVKAFNDNSNGDLLLTPPETQVSVSTLDSPVTEPTKVNKGLRHYRWIFEPLFIGVLLGIVRYLWDLNYGLLISAIAAGVILRFQFSEGRCWLVKFAYTGSLYIGILAIIIGFQQIRGLRDAFFELLTELSLILGVLCAGNIQKCFTVDIKLPFVIPRAGLIKTVSWGLGGALAGYILVGNGLGLLMIPTLIWIGASLGRIMLKDYMNWLGMSGVFALGVIASVFIGHFNAFSFLKYSFYEFGHAYGYILMLYGIEFLLIAVSCYPDKK